jgi:hypothetical protein
MEKQSQPGGARASRAKFPMGRFDEIGETAEENGIETRKSSWITDKPVTKVKLPFGKCAIRIAVAPLFMLFYWRRCKTRGDKTRFAKFEEKRPPMAALFLTAPSLIIP